MRDVRPDRPTTSRYVYLSDGGHFENLGLYEMVLRRCRCIVVSDAGCDPEFAFDDLGNAIRKIRIDLGVPITFERRCASSAPRSRTRQRDDGAYFAIGDDPTTPTSDGEPAQERLRCSTSSPAITATRAPDVFDYATANAAFPHESTGDQFFSESQFESYRALGFEITGRAAETRVERGGQNVQTTSTRTSRLPPSARSSRPSRGQRMT